MTNRTNISIIFSLLLILLLSTSLSSKLDAEILPVSSLNLGSFTASEEIIKDDVYYIKTNGNQLEFEIWLEQNFTDKDRCLGLPMERLKVKVGDLYQGLSAQPVVVQLEKNKDKLFPLILSMRVTPEDRPGSYSSIIHIRKTKGQAFEEELSVRLEIKPWLILKSEAEQLELSNHRHDYSLSNETLAVLKVASNTPWVLYSSLPKLNQLPVELKPAIHLINNGSELQIFENRYLKKEPVLMASGPPTVLGDNYWIEIGFVMEVSDYRGLPAGEIYFDTMFNIESLKDR